MQALLEHFILQSALYSLIAVALVAFLESLALVGLILPGTVMMAGLGALIGSGELNFWHAWLAGIIGCLLGDWISFWLGWRFKKPLHRWSFMKKNKALLDKTEHALHQHSMFTILVGRFVGPTRPLVPMVAGMLDLPVAKFIVPNIIGCVLWPPFYFLPGILAGAAIDIPADMQSGYFKWLLLATALLLWLAAWLVTERTLWGKYVRAIGQNSEAARIAGIRDRLTMLGVLVAASALCAVGGVILSANLRQFTPLAGQSYLMDAIAAVFIGTAFTRLGRVSILGTLGGVLFLAIIDNGLNLMGLNYLVKDALVGVILVVALALSFWQARLRQTHR